MDVNKAYDSVCNRPGSNYINRIFINCYMTVTKRMAKFLWFRLNIRLSFFNFATLFGTLKKITHKYR